MKAEKVKMFAARRHKGAILAICFVAISVVMIMTSTILFMVQNDAATTKRMKQTYETAREIREIGNSFSDGTLAEGETVNGAYTCTVTKNADTFEEFLTVTRTDTGTTVLRVTVRTENETRKILAWNTVPVPRADDPKEGT